MVQELRFDWTKAEEERPEYCCLTSVMRIEERWLNHEGSDLWQYLMDKALHCQKGASQPGCALSVPVA